MDRSGTPYSFEYDPNNHHKMNFYESGSKTVAWYWTGNDVQDILGDYSSFTVAGNTISRTVSLNDDADNKIEYNAQEKDYTNGNLSGSSAMNYFESVAGNPTQTFDGKYNVRTGKFIMLTFNFDVEAGEITDWKIKNPAKYAHTTIWQRNVSYPFESVNNAIYSDGKSGSMTLHSPSNQICINEDGKEPEKCGHYEYYSKSRTGNVTWNDASQWFFSYYQQTKNIKFIKFGDENFKKSLSSTFEIWKWKSTLSPTSTPSSTPSSSPSSSPSAEPSNSPSASPSTSPSAEPSNSPSASPSTSPSAGPSNSPSASPSTSPSASPSLSPSSSPSAGPSNSPSSSPSASPSTSPSSSPSSTPSSSPSQPPTVAPSDEPTSAPTESESFLSKYVFKYGKIPAFAAAVIIVLLLLCICVCICKKCNKQNKDIDDETLDEIDDVVSTDYRVIDMESSQGNEEEETETENEYIISFNVNTNCDVRKILKKLMRINGFEEKVHKIIDNDDDTEKVQIVIGHFGDDLTDNPAIREALELLQSDENVQNVQMNDINEANANADNEIREAQEMIILEFKTMSDENEIESFHEQLLAQIMAIPGFEEKLHKKQIDVKSDRKGKIKFLLRQPIDIAMEDETIQSVLELIKNNPQIKKINLDEAEPLPAKLENENEQMTELTFRTKGAFVEDYHQELLEKMINIRGFEEQIYDRKIEIIADNKGKMKFVLMLSVDTAMNDESLSAILELLRNEDRVKRINVDAAKPVRKANEVILLKFTTKCEDAEQYAKDLIAECLKIGDFEKKMVENQTNMVKDTKAKSEFIMRCSMEDEDLIRAMNFLSQDDNVSKVKTKIIPYDEEKNEEEEIKKKAIVYQEMTELTFKTKGSFLKVYHEDLLKKMMNVPGFYDKIFDRKIEIVAEREGEMQFLLMQSAHEMDIDVTIQEIKKILENEERVEEIEFDESHPLDSSNIAARKAANEPKAKLTKAIILSFFIKCEDAKRYAKELFKNVLKIGQFRHKLYEKRLTILRKDKAKYQLVCYHSGDNAMEDEDLTQALKELESNEKVSKLKAETIPYFLESG